MGGRGAEGRGGGQGGAFIVICTYVSVSIGPCRSIYPLSQIQKQQETLQELADFNKRYEDRFGYIFLVCATGKTADEMLALLKARMGNEAEAEVGGVRSARSVTARSSRRLRIIYKHGMQLKVAAGEQGKITVLRLNKLLLALGEEKEEGGSRL